jgi:hypothetical protein
MSPPLSSSPLRPSREPLPSRPTRPPKR